MKNRMGLLILIAALALSSLATAGCNKERPAPTPVSATALPVKTVAPTPAVPAAAVTQLALPTQPSAPTSAQTALATPPPIAPQASPTPPPPAPLPTAGTPGSGNQPAAGASNFFTYQVALGDTLGEVAEKFGVTSEQILNLNSLADPDVLMVGQELKIPGQAPPELGGPSTYTVRTGDTLYSIALRFGVTLVELQDLNNIADENQIYVSQELKIPATAVRGDHVGVAGGQQHP
ncbi:MAG: hypothetical protein CVU38_16215 [Chloroflexi bacterium HGW-Chloroflexi-1]|nr:MAG: hypothetical protein CVU38_16215 [Chloroflexi bacterium HGW-Chloroflexi-1]